MNKRKAVILGSGNIGTDLMMKLSRSSVLQLTAMIGIDASSDGLARARGLGYEAIDNGIRGLLERPELADIVFDATSAKAHIRHAKLLKELGITAIDLTPAAVGPGVVPTVNLDACLNQPNVNLITCGGQATIPIVHAIGTVVPVAYAEIVATISSRSAGPGTRANIDEFTSTTARGLERIGGARKGKAIILLNPADPPILMRNTIYALAEEGAGPLDEDAIRSAVLRRVADLQAYMPGYRLRMEPIFDGRQITVMVEVEGAGDYFPPYAGNLDIMTSAAVRAAEQIARIQLTGGDRGR